MRMVILVVSADSVYQQIFFSVTVPFKKIFVFCVFLFLKETKSSAGMKAGQVIDRQLTPCT